MRAGKFYVNKKQVEDESVLDLIFNMRFTPVLVEYNVMTGMYEYSGTSSLFDEIEYGDMTPEYNIITTRVVVPNFIKFCLLVHKISLASI